jgi:hypothetical protein
VSIAGVRGAKHERVPPRSELRHWLWLSLSLVSTGFGCTLTADDFEPSSIGASPSPPLVSSLKTVSEEPSAEDVTNASLNGSSADERLDMNGRFEPASMNPGQLGASQATDAADVGLADEGTEQADAGSRAALDAGSASAPSAACPSLAFGGSCYEYFGELVSWDVAEQRCVVWGGHLASVESSEEDAFLAGWPRALGIPAQDGSGIWLGATDAARDGDFRWWDTSPLVFANWGANQPDNAAGVDCIEKRNDPAAAWYDQRCVDQHRYVCERQL